jgi:hypothetical protein
VIAAATVTAVGEVKPSQSTIGRAGGCRVDGNVEVVPTPVLDPQPAEVASLIERRRRLGSRRLPGWS